MFHRLTTAFFSLMAIFAVAMLIGLTGLSSAVFAQAGPPTPMGGTPSADFWLQIRQGKTGTVAGSKGNADWLIRRIDRDKECLKAGTCTERLVGMVVPIHKEMPNVREPIGVGASKNEMYFVYGLAGLLLLGGLAFLGFGLGPRKPDQAA